MFCNVDCILWFVFCNKVIVYFIALLFCQSSTIFEVVKAEKSFLARVKKTKFQSCFTHFCQQWYPFVLSLDVAIYWTINLLLIFMHFYFICLFVCLSLYVMFGKNIYGISRNLNFTFWFTIASKLFKSHIYCCTQLLYKSCCNCV